ncbi:hypothetical protein C8J57DRAFT_1291227 [Mycena rebaudengoi]|nr:hypothetical protein C8J57DRAFT_1291227 [Mycena rebaudengoi]
MSNLPFILISSSSFVLHAQLVISGRFTTTRNSFGGGGVINGESNYGHLHFSLPPHSVIVPRSLLVRTALSLEHVVAAAPNSIP